MTEHIATIEWSRNGANFLDNRYSRSHIWSFDGGIGVPASSSPHVVPVPMSEPRAVDPEEAFVASLSSCHMLWFLSIAAKQGFIVKTYKDSAVGIMGKDADGKVSMVRVELSPETAFSGERQPTMTELEAVHHIAHQNCYIANSVKSEVRCTPILAQITR
jgi:organic hydroperoxide reductase OsmC/OhrA